MRNYILIFVFCLIYGIYSCITPVKNIEFQKLPEIKIQKEIKNVVNNSTIEFKIKTILTENNLYSDSMFYLLLGTMAVESDYGKYDTQFNGGPAKGRYQMEPFTMHDIFEHYLKYNKKLKKLALKYVNKNKSLEHNLQYNLEFQTILAAIHYLRACDRYNVHLPKKLDPWTLSSFWKRYYNSKKGKGTTSKFYEKYQMYVMK